MRIIETMAYNWIFFDADNTLFDFNHSEGEALKNTLEDFGELFEEHYHPVYSSINRDCWQAFEHGQLSKAELRTRRFDLFFYAIGRQYDAEEFAGAYLDHLSKQCALIQGAQVLLEQLHQTHHLALVTNGLKEVQRPRLARSGLAGFFKMVVVSDEIGHAKPDRAFFDYTFDAIGRPDHKTVLMVGDNLNADIRGAAEYGLDTCWYNPGKETSQTIKATYEIGNLEELHGLV